MTIEELSHRAINIYALEADFDYVTAQFTMTIKPAYLQASNSDLLSDKLFSLTFNNCIYIQADNTSQYPHKHQFEFEEWGVKPPDCCHQSTCKLLQELFKRITNPTFTRLDKSKPYQHTYFANLFGDRLDILAESTTITELKTG